MILVLVLHLGFTAAMVGLIWFVQIVHYPLFASVGEAQFVAYEHIHRRLTGWVVGPLMGAESVLALLVAVRRPAGLGWVLPVIGLALLGVIHASTTFVQVPLHKALSVHRSEAVIDRLVRTNWVRTIGWTARAGLAVAMLVKVA